MKGIKIYLELSSNEVGEFLEFVDNSRHDYDLDEIEIARQKGQRSRFTLKSPLNTITLAIVTSATAAAMAKGLFDLLKEYLRIRFEREKMAREAAYKKTPLVLRIGDREVSIPSHMEEEERNRLLQIVVQGVAKQIEDTE